MAYPAATAAKGWSWRISTRNRTLVARLTSSPTVTVHVQKASSRAKSPDQRARSLAMRPTMPRRRTGAIAARNQASHDGSRARSLSTSAVPRAGGFRAPLKSLRHGLDVRRLGARDHPVGRVHRAEHSEAQESERDDGYEDAAVNLCGQPAEHAVEAARLTWVRLPGCHDEENADEDDDRAMRDQPALQHPVLRGVDDETTDHLSEEGRQLLSAVSGPRHGRSIHRRRRDPSWR